MLPMTVKQAHIGMKFRYSHLKQPVRTYVIIGDSFLAHGRRVIKARCIDTGETMIFNDWMFQDINVIKQST